MRLPLPLLLVAALVTACDTAPPAPAAPAETWQVAQPEVVIEGPAALATEAAEVHAVDASVYSPWVVDVHDLPAFHQISFKDVGLSVEDPHIYEVLASGLAEALMTIDPAPLDATLSFDHVQADPEHHLACGDAHVYVDVWRSTSPDRFGYSLWSGCEESSQFAWAEVPMLDVTWTDPTTTLTPLTVAIASSLGDAIETGCFRSTC